MTHYFISDLHLSDKRPDLIQAFVNLSNILLDHKALDASCKLHIVGDFYEAWIGDDFQSEWNNTIEQSLIKLSESGLPIKFYHGNRDFLIGHDWASRVGAQLVKNTTCIKQGSHSLLISHGDEACLDDVAYQQFRQMVRQKEWQSQVLSMPLSKRIALASQLREDSKQSNSEKMLDIMDVDSSEIDRLMSVNKADIMIHGHTHRPNLHQHVNGTRLVLGDWDKSAWLAVLSDKSLNQYKINLDFINKETSKLNFENLISQSELVHSLDL